MTLDQNHQIGKKKNLKIYLYCQIPCPELNSLKQKTYLPFSYAHKNPYHCLNFHVLMKIGNGRK